MYSKSVTIRNEVGLHARPATFFIQKAQSFSSSIWIKKDDKTISAKSFLGILSLGITKGVEFTIEADGKDEEKAVNSLVELVENGLGE